MFLGADMLALEEGPKFWRPSRFISSAGDPFGLLPNLFGHIAGLPKFAAFTKVVSVSTLSPITGMPEHPSQDRMQAIACMEAPRMGGRVFLGCVT